MRISVSTIKAQKKKEKKEKGQGFFSMSLKRKKTGWSGKGKKGDEAQASSPRRSTLGKEKKEATGCGTNRQPPGGTGKR